MSNSASSSDLKTYRERERRIQVQKGLFRKQQQKWIWRCSGKKVFYHKRVFLYKNSLYKDF